MYFSFWYSLYLSRFIHIVPYRMLQYIYARPQAWAHGCQYYLLGNKSLASTKECVASVYKYLYNAVLILCTMSIS